jgi:hypothetical protein
MKISIYACLLIPALISGCSPKDESAQIQDLAPSSIIEAAAQAHGVDPSFDSGGAGSGGGYANRTWNYFSKEKGVSDDKLRAIVNEATEGIRKKVIEMGGRAEPIIAWGGYFQIQSFDYSLQGRRGTMRVTAGALERGTAVTVIAEERRD